MTLRQASVVVGRLLNEGALALHEAHVPVHIPRSNNYMNTNTLQGLGNNIQNMLSCGQYAS